MSTLIILYFVIPLLFLPIVLTLAALPEFRRKHMTLLADGPEPALLAEPHQAPQPIRIYAANNAAASTPQNGVIAAVPEQAYVYTGYKHCSVIDAQGGYQEFVQVHIFTAPNGSTEDRPQYYTLKPGERLVDATTPTRRQYAGAAGFIRPMWDNEAAAWVEDATEAEIAAWEAEHPAPPATPAVPTVEEQLRADVDFLAALEGVTL